MKSNQHFSIVHPSHINLSVNKQTLPDVKEESVTSLMKFNPAVQKQD